MITTVVRGFGYGVHHAVTVPEESVRSYVTMGSEFSGIQTPLVAHCGRQIRSCQGVVVVMQVGSPVTCRQCRMFSGLEVQTEESKV